MALHGQVEAGLCGNGSCCCSSNGRAAPLLLLLSPSLSPSLPLSPYLVYKLLARVHHVDQCPGSLGGAWLELP